MAQCPAEPPHLFVGTDDHMVVCGADARRVDGDVYSDATVTYYFDARTLAPLAAVYHVVTDTDQKINIYQDEADVGNTAPSGYVKVEIVNTADTYYFFD